MARLQTHVYVQDDQGVVHVFGPADDVPAWAVEKITNPNVWEEAPADNSAKSEAPRKAPARRTPKE